MGKLKLVIIIIVVFIIGLFFVSVTSHRGYHREGLISTFTHSAARGAGSYVGYRAAKHFMYGDGHRDDRRDSHRRYKYSYSN